MNDLLKVLDMSEDEQFGAVLDLLGPDISVADNQYFYMNRPFCSLADLAFRLRDEAVMLKGFPWVAAEIYNKAHGFELGKAETHAPTTMVWIWFAAHAKPIHWIIAALIAKEQR